MKVKTSTYRVIFGTAIGLSVAGCGSDSAQLAEPDKVILDKYTAAQYKDIIDDCDSVISKYSKPGKVINNGDVKMQMSWLGLAWHSFYGRVTPAQLDSTRTDYFDKRDSAMHVLYRYQEDIFPKFRSAFAEYAAKLLWEQDCKAEAIGERNEILELTGNYFLPNANKQKTYDTLKDVAKRMRFQKMRFRWYSSASDYYDYELNPSKDRDYISMTE